MKVLEFKNGIWDKEINVRDFVIQDITPYYGNHDFLVGPSQKTQKLWDICKSAVKEERQNNGVRSVDTETISEGKLF